MSKLKTIKDMFWESAETSITPSPMQQTSTPEVEEPTIEISSQKGSVDSKIKTKLLNAIEKANLPGFDYFELKQSMRDMEDDHPDEVKRMKAVYSTAKTLGITVASLVDSANHYIGVLGEEKQAFEETLQEKFGSDVTVKKTSLQELDKKIQSNQKEIEKLNNEIAKAQDDKAKLASQVSEAEVRISTARTNFSATYDQIVNEIKSDIKKIKSNLGTGVAK